MSLRDGDAAADGDVWFRLITSESHISRGKIKAGAFKGKFLGKAKAGRPWTTEISGRLRSVAGSIDDIGNHAETYCKARQGSGQKFAGLMFCSKRAATKVFDKFSMDVYFTPILSGSDADPAHSDLGITGPLIQEGSAEHDQLIIELSDILRGLHNPDQIDLLPEAQTVGSNQEAAETPQAMDKPTHGGMVDRILRKLGLRSDA